MPVNFEKSLENRIAMGRCNHSIRGGHGSHCSGNSLLIMLGGTEHQLLVYKSQSLRLHLSRLKTARKRRLGHLKVFNVEGSPVKQGNFARLLVGCGQDVL